LIPFYPTPGWPGWPPPYLLKIIHLNIAVIIDLPEAVDGAQAILLEGKSMLVLDPVTVQELTPARVYTW